MAERGGTRGGFGTRGGMKFVMKILGFRNIFFFYRTKW